MDFTHHCGEQNRLRSATHISSSLRSDVQQSLSYRMESPLPRPPSQVEIDTRTLFDQTETLGLREYWRLIQTHFRLIVVVFLIIEVVTLIVVSSETPIYSSASTILIEREAPEVLGSKEQNNDSDYDSDAFYKTQYEMLQSRSLAARVISDYSLERNKQFIDADGRTSALGNATAWLRSLVRSSSHRQNANEDSKILGVEPSSIDVYVNGLTVRPIFDTRLVSVGFSSPDPALTAEIANAHVREFIRQNYLQHTQTNEEAQHYLEGKLSEIEARTEKSEAALNSYRRQRGIVEFSLDDKDQIASDRLGDINRNVVQAEASRISLEADLQTIQSNDYESLPDVVESGLIQTLKEQSASLEGQYASMSNQFTPDYPPLAQLRAQLLAARSREQQEIKKVVQSIKAKYTSAVDRENQLRNEFEHEKDRAMALKDASLQEAVLARDVETNRALYQSVLERIKTLGVASESQMTNVTVVDPAEMPRAPSAPKKELIMVLTGFLALLGGIATVFILDATDNGLKTADEVQAYLQLPNLATIVRFVTNAERLAGKIEGLTGGPDAIEIRDFPSMWVRPSMHPQCTIASEGYRAIRTGILLSRAERPPKTVLFTSAAGGEGKSLIATNSAIMFAQTNERVLLVDADLRRPRCHEILGQECGPGLTELLTASQELKDLIQSTPVKGLFFLSSGLTPPNPSELLGSQRMREILSAAISSYDYVLIDSPPVLPVSDSVLLSILVDGVVLVASAQTSRTAVRDACARLIHVGARMLGVVLNHADPKQQRNYAPYYSY